MQDRYVGDVGDFAKYALLRRLCGISGEHLFRLGLSWYLFPDETHNSDGRHISYLKSKEFQNLDDNLLAALSIIVEAGQRSISSILSSGVLPPETVSYHDPVSPAHPCRRQDRISFRFDWLMRCLTLTDSCDFVFFDPDNGVEVGSVPKHHSKGGKYVYWDELGAFWDRGDTLVIYHHLNRIESAARQIEALKLQFTALLKGAAAEPFVFRRGSSRVFWLVHRGDMLGQELERRAADFLNAGWSRHFRPLGWPSHDQAGTATE